MALVKIDMAPTTTTLRQFGYISLAFFGCIGGYWFYTGSSLGMPLMALGAISGTLSIVYPDGLKWLYIGLMVVTFPIGFVASHIILGILYFCILTPIGVIMRAMGYDP